MNEYLDELFESAIDAIRSEELIEANEILSEMVEIDAEDPRTIEITGDVAKESGEYEQAEDYYRRLESMSDIEEIRGRAQMSLAFLFRDQEQPEAAVDYFRRSIDSFRAAGCDEERLICTGAIAEMQLQGGSFRDSVDTFQTIIDEFEQDEEVELHVIDAMRQQAEGYRFLGELEKAETNFREVMNRSDPDDDEMYEPYAVALDGLGVLSQIQGRYAEADEFHQEALRLNREFDDDIGCSVNMGNLARLNIHRQNWDEAERYLRESMAIDAEREDLNFIGYGHLIHAEIECGRGNYDSAEERLQRALKIAEDYGMTDDKVSAVSKLGYLRRLQGRFDEAEKFQAEARQMAEQMEHADGIAATIDELAEIRKAQGRLDEARDLWNDALQRYEQLNSIECIRTVKANLSGLGDGQE